MRFKGFLWLCIAAFTTNSALAMIQEPTDATRITDHHINYTIDQDSNYIFLNISTTHKETTLSILRHGLTVYFDETGNKERNVFVRYPYHNTPQRPNRSSRPQNNTDEAPSIDYQEIIANIPGEAEYAFYGDQQEFHKDLNAFDISLGYQMTGEEQDTLEYSIKIPKNRITQDDKLDLSKLTIGIFTNMPEKKIKIVKVHQILVSACEEAINVAVAVVDLVAVEVIVVRDHHPKKSLHVSTIGLMQV